MIKRLFGQDTNITVDLYKTLTSAGVRPTDVTDVAFTVKSTKKDVDADALILKTFADGVTFPNDPFKPYTFSIRLVEADFEVAGKVINPDKEYQFGIGYKIGTSTKYTELRIKDSRVTFIQDTIRG